MLSEEEFLNRVKNKASPRDNPKEIDRILNSLRGAWGNKEALLNEAKDFRSPNDQGLYRYDGLAYFFDLLELQEIMKDQTFLDNWIYDRRSKCLIVNIFMGHHETLMNYLYTIYTGKSSDWNPFKEDRAGDYIRQGFGFFLSSVSMKPQKGENVNLSIVESLIFGGYVFRDV